MTKRTSGLQLLITPYEAGANLYRRTGETLPKEVLDACLAADAISFRTKGMDMDGHDVQDDFNSLIDHLCRVNRLYSSFGLPKWISSPTSDRRLSCKSCISMFDKKIE